MAGDGQLKRVLYLGGFDERTRRLHGHVARSVLADGFPDLSDGERTVILRAVAIYDDPLAGGPSYGLFEMVNDTLARLSPRGHDAFAKVFNALIDTNEALDAEDNETIPGLTFFQTSGLIGVTRAPIEVVTRPLYPDDDMDTAKAYAVISRESGVPVDDLRKLVADAQKRAAGEVTARTTEPAPAASPDPPPAPPSEKWESSPEKAFRKQRAIITFLERVWEPFIQSTGTVVTRDVLADHDADAERALTRYLERHDMPKEISIIYPKQLEKIITERPELARALLRATDMPDIR